MADLKYVTYCGLYCKLCTTIARAPRQARDLRDTMRRDGWEHYGEMVHPGFGDFWRILNELGADDETCLGCRGGCGRPDCEIRVCARERQVEICPLCDDCPCERVEALGRSYPTLIADGARLRAVGIDAWIAEQEERRATGFAYADIRCPDA